MDNKPHSSKGPMWDLPSWMKGSVANPLDIFAAPQSLTQAILPGWILGSVVNITGANSSAPDTERDVVAAHSYGRQLGRVIDALAVVIAELPKARADAQAQAAFDGLIKLKRDIDAVKVQASARRLDRIASDLSSLRQDDPDAYRRVAANLRAALDAS
jgi:hypothetical protein